MVDIIKQDMTDIWAIAGDVVAPDSAKVRAGWAVEAVPRQWWNWFENRQDTNIAYMLQKGIPEWDSFTEYLTNKSYVQRNNIVYKAIAVSTDKDPALPANVGFWVKAFPESTPYLEKIKDLAVVPSTVPAVGSDGNATNLPFSSVGAGLLATATDTAARALISAQLDNINLTALSAITAGTNLLPYFTNSTTAATTALTQVGRNFLAAGDTAAQRTVLGLGNASLSTVTGSRYDTTAGALLKVGDFGLGQTSATPVADCNAITASGFYTINGSTSNIPSGASIGGTLIHTAWDANTNQQVLLQNGRMWQRQGGGSTWTAWVESWTSSNLVKTTSNSDNTSDRMLKVGDFGLGGQGIVVTDLNSLSTAGSGFYKLTSPYTNAPIAGTSFTVLQQAFDNERTQIATAEGPATVRTFIRKFSLGTTWGSWVELYHTGNTASIVSQVTAGIQPTLDAKVNKSGDTMTGTLIAPQLYLPGAPGDRGYIIMKKQSSAYAYDALIESNVAGTSGNGTGQLQITAGNVLVSGALSGTSTVSSYNGAVVLRDGVIDIKPSGATDSNNAHLYFRNLNGTTRGILYANNAGTVMLQTGSGLTNVTFNQNGVSAFGYNVTAPSVTVSGRVQCGDVQSNGWVLAGGGTSSLRPDGNVFGSGWAGGDAITHVTYYLSTKLDSALVDFTYIYPNGGSAGAPATLVQNTRYVSANPFPGYHVLCVAEVLYKGIWAISGFAGNLGTGAAHWSTTSSQFFGSGEIVTQTGVSGLMYSTSAGTGGGHGFADSTSVTSAQVRVKVFKLRGTY